MGEADIEHRVQTSNRVLWESQPALYAAYLEQLKKYDSAAEKAKE